MLHQMGKGFIRQRIKQVDPLVAIQNTKHRLSYIGIHVHWINDLDMRVTPHDLSQGSADAFQGLTKILTSVCCHQDERRRRRGRG